MGKSALTEKSAKIVLRGRNEVIMTSLTKMKHPDSGLSNPTIYEMNHAGDEAFSDSGGHELKHSNTGGAGAGIIT